MGGLVDRRIGEGDAGMTAEERAVRRFAREKEGRGGGVFDLEGSGGEAEGVGLTHLGRRLGEFDDVDLVGEEGSEDEDEGDGLLRRKRRRSSEDEEEEGVDGVEDGEEQPERKKSKKEVMQEVIAKSKLHKYERQKVKEDDDDLREELDNGMADMLALLQGHKPVPKAIEKEAETAVANGGEPTMNPDRQRLLDGMDRVKADKEYEVRLRQLAQDTRAKPSERTKTEEEKVKAEAERLRVLEEGRAKRMRGVEVEDDDDADDGRADDDAAVDGVDAFEEEEEADEAAEFGFASSAPQPMQSEEAKVTHDDEDEFAVDDDLIANDSDVELSDEESDASEDSDAEAADPTEARDEEEDDEFVKGILGDSTTTAANNIPLGSKTTGGKGLAYTYPCPRTHAELLDVIKDIPVDQLPIVVQRIRALHHPSLSASNKEAMADFSAALVDHISYMADHHQPLPIIEQLIRHLHSLSRTYPTQIAEAFRRHLQVFHQRGQPSKGDLVVLTAIGSIYPTSDHFHQVVTPAITLMARWLGLSAGTLDADAEGKGKTGAFLVALCVSYQKLSKRFVSEALRFTLRALGSKSVLAAEKARPHLDNLVAMADLWKDLSAFPEIFDPALPLLQKLGAKKEAQHIRTLLQHSYSRRRPLELHHHKKLPIRTSIPKFEEGFNPDKHYDPDKERSEARKLQKEFKREKKGAVRELRKDANFMAREGLREKRERDGEHERRERRLIAEIQGEEGRENRGYAREQRARKGGRG